MRAPHFFVDMTATDYALFNKLCMIMYFTEGYEAVTVFLIDRLYAALAITNCHDVTIKGNFGGCGQYQ